MALGNTPRSRTNVYLDRSKSFSFELEFENTDGSAFPLTGRTVRLVVEAPQRYGGDEVINMVSTHDTEDDSITRFPLQASDLALEPGEYPYDVTLIDEQQYSSPILKGVFVIGANTDDDATNIYTGVDPANGVLIVMGGSEAVKVVVDYPVGVKGDKGDKGDQGDPTGVFVQPDEPGPDDEPPVDSALWVDTDDDSGHDHDGQYAPIVHDHDSRYYTEAEMDSKLAGKAAVSHDHDSRYYTEAEMDAKLAGKAAVSHDHDSRYYTEAEMDSKLAGKAAVSHNHDSRYYTESEVDAKLAGKSNTGHSHDGSYASLAHVHDERYYTESEVDSKLAEKSSINHNHDGQYAAPDHHHDDLYYGEAEVDTLLDGKSDIGHDHDGRYATPADLRTESILSEAAWHVDANMLTAGNDGLADQSGNGRDAMFGAGAAAPLVLPWDGEDYYYIGAQESGGGNALGWHLPDVVPQPGDTWYCEMDITIESRTGNYLGLVYAGSNRPIVVYAASSGRFLMSHGPTSVTAVHSEPDLWVPGERAVFRWECHGASGTITVYKNGVQVDQKQTSNPVDYMGSQASQGRFGGAYNGGSGAIYAAELGVIGAGGDEPRVRLTISQDGTTWTNPITGNAGTVLRADSGFKTAVVDRPLLLFGGGQHAVNSGLLGDAGNPNQTVLLALRTFGTADEHQTWVDARTDPGGGRGPLLRRLSTDNYDVWFYPTRGAGFGDDDGQHVICATINATEQREFFDGGFVRSVATDPLWSGSHSRPLRLGAHANLTSQWAEGEFLAAAIFDRALTDDEVALASQELLGVPHYKQPNPHPQYVLRAEQTRVSRPNGTDRLVEVWDGAAWVATHYDSGVRNIDSIWTPGNLTVTGRLRRVGSLVTWQGQATFTGTPVINSEFGAFPTGFVPFQFSYSDVVVGDASGTNTAMLLMRSTAALYRAPSPPAGSTWRWTVAYPTSDPVPTGLPGTPIGTAP